MDDRYNAGAKSLNTRGGSNRFKFESKKSRAKRVDVDVTHKIRAEGYLDADSTQELDVHVGSFFQQELDRCKELNATPPFKRFYYKAWPFVQSLPELLHHSTTVVDMILALLENPAVAAQAGEQALQLLSVLGRDLQGSFFPHFRRVSGVLVNLLDSPEVSPEVCGRVLRCLGFLLKFVAKPLAADTNALRSLYAPLLGHRRDFARRMAAQSLAPAVRRMKPKAMLKHAKHLIQALAAGRAGANADADADAVASAAGKGQAREGARGAEKLCLDVLDGSSQLLFFLLKGVHGRLHSQAPMLLRIIFDAILPTKRGEVDEKTCVDQDRAEERRRDELRREWCFELARAVLGLVVEHVRSPYSADLWLELHCALGNASARHQASLAEKAAEREDGGEGTEESVECAAVRRTTDLLSLAVGHMRGILLREESVAVKQSALLAELLVDLTRSDVFHTSRTSHACRTAIIDLVVVSLSGLHQQKRLVATMPKVIQAIVVDGTEAEKVGEDGTEESWSTHPALVLARSVLGGLGSERTAYEPPPMSVTQAVALPPLLETCARALLDRRRELLFEILMRTIHGSRVGLAWRGGDDPGYASAEDVEEGLGSEEDDVDEKDYAGSLVVVRGGSGVKPLPLSSETSQKLMDLCCSTLETAAATFDRGADGGERPSPVAMGLPTWVAVLRCLPCIVGSLDSTETLRLEAVRSALESVEKLMVALVGPEASQISGGNKKMSKKAAASKRSSFTKPGGVSDGNAREPWPWVAGRELTILRAFALEAGVGLCGLLPSKTAGLGSGDGDVLSMLMEWHRRSTAWLKANPRSIATVRAVGLLLRAIRTASCCDDSSGRRGGGRDSGYPPCLSSEASLVLIDLLGGNMCSESRLLRLHTARVLAQYEPLPFASEVGRGDGGADGDGGARSATASSSRDGGEEVCTFLQIVAAVEATPISIATERDLTMRLGQLEVMGRSGRLPSEYVRLLTTYALGLLRNKFSSVWPRAAAIVGALYGRPDQREIVWQPVSRMLRDVMPPPPARDRVRSTSEVVDNAGGRVAEKASDKRRQAATGRRANGGDASGSRRVAADGEKADELTAEEKEKQQNQRQEPQRGLPYAREMVSPPRPWLPRLTSTAAEMDQGPREEIDLPPALHGLYLDECVRTGLQPEAGEVPLWATTDDDSMFAQVWEVLAQCPELLQQNSRAVVPLFLAFMAYQYLADRAFPDDPEVRAVDIETHLTADERAFGKPGNWVPQGEDCNGRERAERTGGIVARVASRTSVRARLAAVLGVFAKVPGPKSLYKQRVLFRVYRALITVSDEKISKPALRCMLSYKPPFLLPYKTHLDGLLNHENFRDELVTFSLESGKGADRDDDRNGGGGKSWLPSSSGSKRERKQEDAPGVDPKHRRFLLPVVIRLVYGRLSGPGARGRGGGTAGPAARRSAILSFLSGLASEELAELFALMIRPLLGPEAQSGARVHGVEDLETPGWEGVGCGSEQALAVLGEVKGAKWGHLERLSSSRLTGFLTMAKDVAKQLGQRALPYVENVLVIVLALLGRSNAIEAHGHGARKIEEDVAGAEDMDPEELQEDDKNDEMEDEIGAGYGDGGAESSRSVSGASESEWGRRRRLSSRALRALCLRALSELLSQYASSYDFTAHKDTLWSLLGDPIARLPGSTIGAVKPPALLSFAVVMVESTSLSPMLSTELGDDSEGSRGLIPAMIDCISAGSSRKRTAGPVVLGPVLNFVERLLVLDGGSLLVPHLDRLISNFSARLNATAAPDKGTGVVGKFDCHMEQILSILARIAEMASSGDTSGGRLKRDGRDRILDASSVAHLMTLLMPALQPERRAPDDSKSSVLRTISALAPRVDAAGARRVWPSLSRLLGPTGSRPSGMAAAAPREALVRALEALGTRPDLSASVGKAIKVLRDLNARDAAALDEPDFAKAVPAYNSLSEGTAWVDVVAAGQAAGKPGVEDAPVIAIGGALAASPIAQHCLHAMHDGEVSVRGAAAAALKRLSREIAARERRVGMSDAAGESGRCPWEGIMRTVLMPGLRAGMGCRAEITRKGFISLLRETLSSYNCDGGGSRGDMEGPGVSASLVPSDLWVLAREDDPESDFFLNACHIQVHRRARALAKARKVIEDVETETRAEGSADSTDSAGRKGAAAASQPAPMMVDDGIGGDRAGAKAGATHACPFRVSTLLNFVLPLALHPLHEATKLSEAGLVDQAVQLIGVVARYLPWTHYNALLRNLMQQVNAPSSGASNSAEKERAMVNAMCAVLNSFHFALVSPAADDRSTADRLHGSSQASEISSRPSSERAPGDAADGIADTNDENVPTDVVLPTTPISTAEEAAARAAADAGDAVWRAVNGRLLGSLRMLLTKEVQAKSGVADKVLRAPVALGMLSLLRRLPTEDFVLQLQPLVMAVVQTLKSRDSHVRDVARETLAKMCRELGPGYLQQVVSELRTCLTMGYQLYVRTFTLHAVLKAVADSYAPPMVPSVDIRSARGDVSSGGDGAVGGRGGEGGAANGGDGDPAVSESMVPGVEDGDDSRRGSATVAPAVPSSLVKPAFDACIPEIVELLLEDIFGESAAAKEADGHNVASSKIKEAKGQKAYDSFEIVARTLLFRPTFTVLAPSDPASVSSVHAIVSPVLSRLEGCENPKDVGKANEALTRIGIGLAANPSVTEPEMFLYVHATVAPFLIPQIVDEAEDEDAEQELSDDDDSDSDSGSDTDAKTPSKRRQDASSSTARLWMASEANVKDSSRKAAADEKRQREWDSVRVLDGASAPKHTGQDRHDGPAAKRMRLSGGGGARAATEGTGGRGVSLSDPAALGAVTLALGLLHSKLKAEGRTRGEGTTSSAAVIDRREAEVRAMADPFVPLLTRCVGKNPHTAIVLVSLRSLGYLLRWKLPSMGRCAPIVGRHVLKRLVRGGIGGIRGEMGQACFKTLSALFKHHVSIFVGSSKGGEASAKKSKKTKRQKRDPLFGLSPKQMRALLAVLMMAIVETEHQNATFGLIRAVVSNRVMLPEATLPGKWSQELLNSLSKLPVLVYDLMNKLAELAVTSHSPTMRNTAGQTFLTFLIQYPLGEKRLQFHLSQILNAFEYEHAEGRLAALGLCDQLISRLPEPNLDQLGCLFYLSLVMRLTNDTASECRAASSAAILTLAKRASAKTVHELLDFTGQWFGSGAGGKEVPNGDGADPVALRRTAAQTAGIFLQARPELVRRKTGGRPWPWILSELTSLLPPKAAEVIARARRAGTLDFCGFSITPSVVDGAATDDWMCVYHAVIALRKALDSMPKAFNAALSSKFLAGKLGAGVSGEGKKSSQSLPLVSQLLNRLLEALLYPHAWVRLATARFWGAFFSCRDPGTLSLVGSKGDGQGKVDPPMSGTRSKPSAKAVDVIPKVDDGGEEFLRTRRILFRLCQNFCAQLNRSQVDPELNDLCVKNLLFVGRAMHVNPELCFAGDLNDGSDDDDDVEGGSGAGEMGLDRADEDEDEDDAGAIAGREQNSEQQSKRPGSENPRDPLRWVFNRMANMVVHKGEARRCAVFTWFAAMASFCEPSLTVTYLRLMLLPLRRAVLDAEAGGAESKSKVMGALSKGTAGKVVDAVGPRVPERSQTAAELANEVMELLEGKVGSAVYLEALTAVNMDILQKRTERKRKLAVEKATDPVAAAERRKERTEASKRRKRRKVEEAAKLRGGTKRMRQGSNSGRR